MKCIFQTTTTTTSTSTPVNDWNGQADVWNHFSSLSLLSLSNDVFFSNKIKNP